MKRCRLEATSITADTLIVKKLIILSEDHIAVMMVATVSPVLESQISPALD